MGTEPNCSNPSKGRDCNNATDVFVYNLKTNEITRVSVDSNGFEGERNEESFSPAISADGQIVVFESLAKLVSTDENLFRDIFVHKQGETTQVSVDSEGIPGDGASFAPALSADGRLVVFASFSTNLVGIGNDANDFMDIFVRDRETGKTELVSVDSAGAQANGASFAPAISADGRFIAFESTASNLVEYDTNGASDVFLHDRDTGETRRVSVGSGGNQGNGASFAPAISANGCVVAFESSASNLLADASDTNNARDIFVYDCKGKTSKLSRVSIATNGQEGNDDSFSPDLSANGRMVAFSSRASNLVETDGNSAPDIFVYDRRRRRINRMSVNADRQEGDRGSFSPSLSATGKFVVFDSDANNLDPNVSDVKKVADIFFTKAK
jgi:Tol biopolymer transport system component